LHINGDGFAVDTYGGSNKVFIGLKDYDYLQGWKETYLDPYFGSNRVFLPDGVWSKCDVIEGACTVDCGGVRKVSACAK